MVPSISSVGSGPTEKIILRIVDITNVRTPDSRGTVITMAADTNITAQIKPDKCCPNSGRGKKNKDSSICNCTVRRDVLQRCVSCYRIRWPMANDVNAAILRCHSDAIHIRHVGIRISLYAVTSSFSVLAPYTNER
jgi:hypothetical protein